MKCRFLNTTKRFNKPHFSLLKHTWMQTHNSLPHQHKHNSSVQLLSCVWLFVTPWNTACQASLSITNSQSLFKLMSIKLVVPSNHLILCHPLLLPSSILPSIRVFSSESVLCIGWPKYWSFSINPSNEYWGLIPFRIDWFDISRVFSSTTIGKQQFFSAHPSL